MKVDKTGFIQYCNNRIKSNNKKIKGLRSQINEYEAIIDVVARVDLNKEIISEYREKIESCFNQIDRCMESNRNSYDLISVMKRVNGIMKNAHGGKIYG